MNGFKFLLLIIFILSSSYSNAQIKYKINVAKDGSGDYISIQDAIDATKSFPDKRIAIYIKNGIYHEKVTVPSWNDKLSLIGENADSTIITWDDYFNKINRGRNSTFFTHTLRVDADDFYAENLTIENTAGKVGQAVALHTEGNRCKFVNCKLLGNQDTFYASGENSHQLFSGCTIEGTTDFIFGSATVVFDQCNIVCKSNSYITAASTTQGKTFGFVFMNCEITAIEGVSEVYLGRPWRPYAKTIFMNCELGSHIRAEGWKEWSNSKDLGTTFYAEYKNSGPGASTENRVVWSQILTDKEAEKYTLENILNINSWDSNKSESQRE